MVDLKFNLSSIPRDADHLLLVRNNERKGSISTWDDPKELHHMVVELDFGIGGCHVMHVAVADNEITYTDGMDEEHGVPAQDALWNEFWGADEFKSVLQKVGLFSDPELFGGGWDIPFYRAGFNIIGW